MPEIARNLRLAARTLARRPGFTLGALATLALGIGGNAAVFSIVDRILVRPLPFRDARRLVRVSDTLRAPGGQTYRSQVLPWHFRGIVERSRSLDRVAAIRPERVTWLGGETATSIQGARISEDALDLLGIAPSLGRGFTRAEMLDGDPGDVALVSTHFWRTRLGGRADALGSRLRLGDGNATVVGVLPEGYRFPYASDVWRPLTAKATDASDPRDLLVVGRLAPKATISDANAELSAIARAQESGTDSPAAIRGRGMEARSLADDLLQGGQRIPLALLAAMGSLLLLACTNLASLVLARSITLRREAAVRAALGATAGAQVRQGLAETMLLSLAGGALGLLFARAAASPVSVLLPRAFAEDLPLSSAASGIEVILFAFAIAAATGLLAGIVPAWKSARTDPAIALSETGRSGTASRSTARWLSAYVVVEVALATVLVGAGGGAVAAFVDERRRPTGLETMGLLSLEVPIIDASQGDPDRARRIVERVLEKVAAVPGVESAAAVTANPFSERRWGIRVAPERTADAQRDLTTVNLRLVSPGLFRTWRTPLLAGRDVAESDVPASAGVALVSRRLARRFWSGSDAVGRRLYRRTPDGALAPMTVVGVVGDVRDSGDIGETVYLPYAQTASLEAARAVYVMARGSPRGDWPKNVPRALARVDPRLGVAEWGFMDALHADSMSQDQAGASIAIFLGAFGLLLAATGVFAVVSFAAAERRPELAIRVALGATPASLRRLLFRDGVRLAVAGGALGLPLALAANRVLASVLPTFGDHPALTVVLALALLAVAALCCDVPARRAARLA